MQGTKARLSTVSKNNMRQTLVMHSTLLKSNFCEKCYKHMLSHRSTGLLESDMFH